VLLAACKNVHERGHCRSCIVEQQTPSAGRHADSSESRQGETLQNVKPVPACGAPKLYPTAIRSLGVGLCICSLGVGQKKLIASGLASTLKFHLKYTSARRYNHGGIKNQRMSFTNSLCAWLQTPVGRFEKQLYDLFV
jgi:hypothetical protein